MYTHMKIDIYHITSKYTHVQETYRTYFYDDFQKVNN